MGAPAVSLRPRPWRWDRPRVLIEHPDESAGLEIATSLRLAGYAVTVCTGPHELGQCPLTGSEGCAPAHDADLVVSCLGFESDAAQEVLHALRARCPDVPLVVEVPPGTNANAYEFLSDSRMLAAPAAPEQIVAAVRATLGAKTTELGDGA